MRVQLWSYNYAPEPTGIAPVSTLLAEGLRDAAHRVSVVSAHPHYPSPEWGRSLLAYREERNGVPVLRLPLLIGRKTTGERVRQELSFMAAQLAALPFLGQADVQISVSPSFPALLPGLINTRVRRTPWVLWLHDLLPDGAAATGLVEGGVILRLSRWLERASYKAADRIVVLSRPFLDNLRAKGVPERKLELIYDPATRRLPGEPRPTKAPAEAPRVLSMGNIGHTQGLAPLVAAFDRSSALAQLRAKLVITGDGVAAGEVRAAISNGRVEMLGVVDDERLEEELRGATLALVSQSYQGTEFNLPSKIMNFMGYGLPIIAAVNPRSEVARLVAEAGAGWIVDSSKPDLLPGAIIAALERPDQLAARGAAAARYAREHFSRDAFIARFERMLAEVARRRAPAQA